jgi:hypothetical protein
MSADELAGWRETGAKQSIVEFVAAVTDPDSPDFVPERDRVAVFDNDGTLWTEQPVYAQLVFALDRAAELGHPTSLEELHAGGMEGARPRPGGTSSARSRQAAFLHGSGGGNPGVSAQRQLWVTR